MVWYRWKWWRLAWNLNNSGRVECSGWVWTRIAGRLMFRSHRTEPLVFRVTDGERCFSCESHYDHFLLRPEDGSEPERQADRNAASDFQFVTRAQPPLRLSALLGRSMDYLELLKRSFVVERDRECGTESRLAYLSDHVFDFTTYDSEMSELLASKATEVCAAINAGATFEYIREPENYKWFLLMCNMPFFAARLNWGTSIRGAWWDHREHHLSSCGIHDGGEQLTKMKFRDATEWKKFIAAIVDFAGGQ